MTSEPDGSEGEQGSRREIRQQLPHEVYAAEADYVQLAMKTMTARRMVGWLQEYAEYAEVSGATKTAEHARHMSKRLQREVEPEAYQKDADDTPSCYNCDRELGEEWKRLEEEAKDRGEHPADCPGCGENPLPPIGGEASA